MIIKDGAFGIVKELHGIWNQPDITLYTQDELNDVDSCGRPNSDGKMIRSSWPKIRGGCSGIIQMEDDTYHLMSEDDDHYRTIAIINIEDIKHLHDGLKIFDDNIDVKIDYMKCTSKIRYPHGVKRFPKIIRKGNFIFEITHRDDGNAPILTIKRDNKEMSSFDISWAKEKIAMMNIILCSKMKGKYVE